MGCENAGGTAGFPCVYIDANGFGPGCTHLLASALAELAIHDKVVPVVRGDSAVKQVAAFIRDKDFKAGG